jgi:GAF domain-containing protein
MNIMPKLLASLAREGDGGRKHEQAAMLESYLSSRLRAGFNLEELVEELAILEREVLCVLVTGGPDERAAPEEVRRILDDLRAGTLTVTRAFRQYLDEDEQGEKRALRLLQEPFLRPQEGEAPLSPARLREAAEILMDAMRAATAAVYLHDVRTGGLVMAASAGLAAEPFARYVRAVDASSFVGTVAGHNQPTAMHDVETTALDVPDALRHSGIHSLLGIRLPAHRVLVGVVYVGLCETRAFSPREERRIEALGERLALLVDNARLHEERSRSKPAMSARSPARW